MEKVRVYEIPACKMVSSQSGTFSDGKLEAFYEWFSSQPNAVFPKDFMADNKQQGEFVWYYMYSEGMAYPDSFKLVDFPGGLYAVASEVDRSDSTEVLEAIKRFIKEKGCFEEDPSRDYLGNIPTPPSACQAMGYNQMDYYVPIKIV